MTAMETLAHRFPCPACGAAAGARCIDVRRVLHVERYDRARAWVAAEHGPRSMPGECACGQLAIDGTGKCATCRGRESAPQGTQQALFAPPPAQLPGQLGL